MSDNGTFDRIAGKAKEAAGKVTGNKDTETEGDAADTSYGSSSASKYAASPERSNTHIQQRDSRESAEAQPKDPLVRPSAAGPDRRYTHRTPGEGLIHPVFEEGAGANAHESARQKTSMFDLVHSKGNLHKAHIVSGDAEMAA